jgi:hypothetical protein
MSYLKFEQQQMERCTKLRFRYWAWKIIALISWVITVIWTVHISTGLGSDKETFMAAEAVCKPYSTGYVVARLEGSALTFECHINEPLKEE